MHAALLVILLTFQLTAGVELYQAELLYSFPFINFTFNSDWDYQQYIANKVYENWYLHRNDLTLKSDCWSQSKPCRRHFCICSTMEE